MLIAFGFRPWLLFILEVAGLEWFLLVLCSRFYGFEMVLRLMEIGLFQQVMVLQAMLVSMQ